MVNFMCMWLLIALSASSAFKLFHPTVISRNQHQLWNPIPNRYPTRTMGLRVRCESPKCHNDDSKEKLEPSIEFQEESTHNEMMSGNVTAAVQELDPVQVAVKDQEERLTKELHAWNENLKSERLFLMNVRDKAFNSGKNAYYAVQAEVNDFVRNKEAEQKADVNKNKRLFVEKMLPIVDAFRQAATIAPNSTPKIESMHTNYGSLLNYIMMVFAKFGFQEFSPALGDAIDVALHEVVEIRETDDALNAVSNTTTHTSPGPVVMEVLRAGWQGPTHSVLRRAAVVASGVLNATSTDALDGGANNDAVEVLAGESADNGSGSAESEGVNEQADEQREKQQSGG